MTRLTLEQCYKLAEYATAPRAKRLHNMRWLDENEWVQITSEALKLCHKHKKPIPEALPKWVKNRQERTMTPLEYWFTQRLKAAYKRWKRKRIATESIARTLSGKMLPGEAGSEVTLELERDETIALLASREAQGELRYGKELTKAQRDAIREEMRPGLEANIGRVFVPAPRTPAPTSSDDADDSALSRTDRELAALDAMPIWGKKCCIKKGGCWRCGYFYGVRRPPEYRSLPLVPDPDMRAIIEAIDNEKAKIGAGNVRVKRNMPESLHNKKTAMNASESVAAPEEIAA